MTVIPSGSLTTSRFKVEVARPCGLSYVCGIFVARSNPVGAYAASDVASAVNDGSIPNRSHPTISPRLIGVAGGLSLAFSCCQEVTLNWACNEPSHAVGLEKNGASSAKEEPPKLPTLLPLTSGPRIQRMLSCNGLAGTPQIVNDTLSTSVGPAVAFANVVRSPYWPGWPPGRTETSPS